ncbi:hypothetical protein ROZALSC1DRAFT_27801, partial [Rozella allomycis CSF55]
MTLTQPATDEFSPFSNKGKDSELFWENKENTCSQISGASPFARRLSMPSNNISPDATPTWKGIKPDPLAFRSTGFLSKKTRLLGKNSEASTPTPNTPSKKMHSKVLLQYTPQIVQSTIKQSIGTPRRNSLLSKAPENNKWVEDVFESQAIRRPGIEEEQTDEDGSPNPSTPHPGHAHNIFQTPLYVRSSSPPFDPQQSPASPSSPLDQRKSFNLYSSPIREDDDRNSMIFDDNDNDENEMAMSPLLLFTRNDEKQNFSSEMRGVSSSIFIWRTMFPHILDKHFFSQQDRNELLNCDFNDKEDYFLKHYEIVESLGSGSFADVYKTRRRDDGLFSAVKKTRTPFQG